MMTIMMTMLMVMLIKKNKICDRPEKWLILIGPGTGPALFVGSWPWPLALDHHDQGDDDYVVTT